MPGLDGTGPMGLGPLTGGGRGFCNPYSALWGTGWRFGTRVPYSSYWPYPASYPYYGRGWSTAPASWPGIPSGNPPYGWARPMFAPGVWPGFPYGMSKEQELDLLKSQAGMLRGQLEQIDSRIEELTKPEK